MSAISINYKYYPFIAIVPGFILGDYIGAIASFFFVREYLSPRKNQVSYELALLKLSSLLIKSDGSVDKNEVLFVQAFFNKTFGNRKSQSLFKQLKETNLSSNISVLVSILKSKVTPVKYYSIIQFLFALASSDGKISRGEDDFIYNVAEELGFDRDRVNQIRNQFVKKKSTSKKYSQEVINHLGVLGLKGGATESELKSAYRNLAKEYHPDKLAGMSDGIKNLAKEKFQEIQDSYEYLMKNYV
jgi:DnaJ like chaperone protein